MYKVALKRTTGHDTKNAFNGTNQRLLSAHAFYPLSRVSYNGLSFRRLCLKTSGVMPTSFLKNFVK